MHIFLRLACVFDSHFFFQYDRTYSFRANESIKFFFLYLFFSTFSLRNVVWATFFFLVIAHKSLKQKFRWFWIWNFYFHFPSFFDSFKSSIVIPQTQIKAVAYIWSFSWPRACYYILNFTVFSKEHWTDNVSNESYATDVNAITILYRYEGMACSVTWNYGWENSPKN